MARDDHLELARRTRAEGALDLAVADARRRVDRHHANRGHGDLEPDDRRGQREQRREGQPAHDEGSAPEELTPAREAHRTVLAGVDPRQGERVDAVVECAQRRGQQRQRRAQDEGDGEHDAPGHRTERGRGHDHDTRERDQHRETREEDRLARRVHGLGDRVFDVAMATEVGAAEAHHDEEGVVDAERQGEHHREVHRPHRDRASTW